MARADPFAWARREVEISLTWPRVAPRQAVVDLAPFRGVESQAAEVRLNGTSVAQFKPERRAASLRDPAAGRGAARGRQPPALLVRGRGLTGGRGPEERRPPEARGGLLQPRRSARPTMPGSTTFSAVTRPGPSGSRTKRACPSLTWSGRPSCATRCACPRARELRFTPALCPRARAAAGVAASFRVTLQEREGQERPVWERTILGARPRHARGGRRAPGRGRTRSSASVSTWERARGDRFAWGAGRRRASWAARRRRRWSLGHGRRTRRGGGAMPAAAPGRIERAASSSSMPPGPASSARTATGAPPRPRSTASPREGIVFENAFTPAVYTLGAMASVWTSQYPDRHHSEVSLSPRACRGPPDPGRAAGARASPAPAS